MNGFDSRRFAVAVAVAMVALAAGPVGETKRPPVEVVEIPGQRVEFKLVKVPAGELVRKGTDGREERVRIKSFWIGQTEVTWDEYDVFWLALDLPEGERQAARNGHERQGNPYVPPFDVDKRHDWPAGSMPCRWAKAYCAWLSKKTGKTYRLPTEAEWEYACRAGGPAGRLSKEQLDKVAWYEDNSEDWTHPVGKKAANAWGLYDMLGNVAEWVTRADGSEVVAGGSFEDKAEDVHCGARAAKEASWEKGDPETPKSTSWYWHAKHVGFRVVREE